MTSTFMRGIGNGAKTRKLPVDTRATAGFTLIEIMVAAFLLLVMAAGFVPLFLTGLSQATSVRHKSIATNIAREKMEQVRKLDYREIQEDYGNATDPDNLSMRFGSSATVRGIPFTIDYSVPPQTAGDLKTVTITVSWNAPPEPTPAVITTLIHQQYVGPRGGRLLFTPAYDDPLGTPFKWLKDNPTVARYYVAEADWSLVYNDFGQAGESPKNVYMRLFFVDDNDAVIPIGPSDDDYRIDTSYLHHGTDPDNPSQEAVYFQYTFDAGGSGPLPDGYWDAKAVIYNEYDEPGNVYKLRVRIENGVPGQPTVTATAQPDNQSFVVTWVPGDERDRDHFTLQWRKQAEDLSWPDWSTLFSSLPPTQYTYVHVGSLDESEDPFGTDLAPNTYEYQVLAVDIAGQSSSPGTGLGQIPPSGTTTTTLIATTTTVPASTTSTTVLATATIRNATNSQWAVVIKNSSGSMVASKTVKNKETWVTDPLAPGHYSITATYKSDVRTGSFTMPDDTGDTPPAFTIL